MSDEAIPPSWALIEIEDSLLPYPNGKRIRQGWSPQCEDHPAQTHDEWAVLRTSAIQDGTFVDAENKKLPESLEPRPHLEVQAGDILITCAGPRSRCGVTCLVRSTRPRLLISGKMYQLRADPSVIDRQFLELFLRESGTRKKIDAMKTGISDSGLNLTHDRFRALTIPLPPLAEQKRIVAKIEELFSELEAGEESLRVARRQLGVYRQSLLKQAFEGKLTEKWRTQNPALVSAPVVPSVTTDKELGTLEALPTGWIWTHLSNVGELGRGKSKHRPRNDAKLFGGPYPFIQTGEVKAASKTVKTYTETYSEFGLAQSKLWPKGTLCITIAANIAETAFLGFDSCFPDSVVGFVPVTGTVNAEFIELFIRAVRSRIEKYAPATAQKNINLTTLENLVVPLCSLPEQQEIVRLLDAQFEVIERNERELDAALERSAALRQAILKRAFTGRLVPQSAADEPAGELLGRLRAERTAAPARVRQSRSDGSGSCVRSD